MTNKMLIDIYLDYRNNFISIGGYASYYGLSDELAIELIIHAENIYKLTYNK